MGKILKTVLWVLALFAVVAGAARLTVLRWWQVPSDDPILAASIEPTLHGGDWVLLWRATPPHFGSLVVCPEPENEGRVVIARLVGEEGDKLTIEGASIELNDHNAINESACAERTFRIEDPTTGSEVEQFCDLEALGGVLHMRGELTGREHVVQKTTRTIGEGKVYLVSDNRAYPYDSRHYAAVDRASCKESIFFRLVSKDGFGDVKNRLTYIR